MRRERISSIDCRPSWNSALRLAARMRPSSSHRQLALVQRVDELRPAVEVQRVRVAKAQVDQAVLDHARRHAQQHQQVLLHQARAAGHVEHGGDLAGRVVHRHRRTGELRELGEEVVLAPHGHRPAGGQAGAHAVGAGLGLAPHAAHAQAQRRRLRRRTRATTPCARSRRRCRSAPPPTRRRPAAGTASSSRSARSRSRRRGARAALRSSARSMNVGSRGLAGCSWYSLRQRLHDCADHVVAELTPCRCAPTSRMRSAWR